MGIKGLLESLRPVQKEINISSYKSKTVAIDGHGILHRRGFGAATNLALKRPTDSYITHFMRYIDLFIYHGITPIVVFDGLPLPLGKAISDKRRHRQNDTLKKGHALYKQGKFAEAEKFFQQAVTITDGIIKAIIKKLVAKKVKCIVAPNEADAQLAHFVKTGKADAVVTENSELLAFGCKKCIYKINRHGNAVEISLDQVLHNDASPFKGYDVETFRHICILSGCDYLASLKGVCLETILKQYKDNKSTAHNLMVLRRKLKKDFPGDYNENFHLANLGFLHRWVFDIDEMNYIRSNPLPSNCSRQDMLKLGKIPTVQDSTIFCVNKAIPKSKPKNKPLKEAITEEFIAFVDTVKENISPLPESPESKLLRLPKSPKSPKSPVLTKSPLLSKAPSKTQNAEPLGEISSQQRRVKRSPTASRIVNRIPTTAANIVSKVSADKHKEQSLGESLQQRVKNVRSVPKVATNVSTDKNTVQKPTESSQQSTIRIPAASTSTIPTNFSKDLDRTRKFTESSQQRAIRVPTASPIFNPLQKVAANTILEASTDSNSEQKLAAVPFQCSGLRVLPSSNSSLKDPEHRTTSSSFTNHLDINPNDKNNAPLCRGLGPKSRELSKNQKRSGESSSSCNSPQWRIPNPSPTIRMSQRQKPLPLERPRPKRDTIETVKEQVLETRVINERARYLQPRASNQAQMSLPAGEQGPSTAKDTRSNVNNATEPVILCSYNASATSSPSPSPSPSPLPSPQSPREYLLDSEEMHNLSSHRKRSFDHSENDQCYNSSKHLKYTKQHENPRTDSAQGSDSAQISPSSLTPNIFSVTEYTRSSINITSAPALAKPSRSPSPESSQEHSTDSERVQTSPLRRKRSFENSEDAHDYSKNSVKHLRRMR